LPHGTFVSLPQGVRINLSAKVSPSTLTIDGQSTNADFNLGEVHVVADVVQKLMQLFHKRKEEQEQEQGLNSDGFESGDATTPLPSDNESASPSTSPASPRRFRSIDPFLVGFVMLFIVMTYYSLLIERVSAEHREHLYEKVKRLLKFVGIFKCSALRNTDIVNSLG
jgi:hypothetical protein